MRGIKWQGPVASKSSKGGLKEYKVTEYYDGDWACNCMNWITARNQQNVDALTGREKYGKPDCKHILEVKAKRLREQKVTSQNVRDSYEPEVTKKSGYEIIGGRKFKL